MELFLFRKLFWLRTEFFSLTKHALVFRKNNECYIGATNRFVNYKQPGTHPVAINRITPLTSTLKLSQLLCASSIMRHQFAYKLVFITNVFSPPSSYFIEWRLWCFQTPRDLVVAQVVLSSEIYICRCIHICILFRKPCAAHSVLTASLLLTQGEFWMYLTHIYFESIFRVSLVNSLIKSPEERRLKK